MRLFQYKIMNENRFFKLIEEEKNKPYFRNLFKTIDKIKETETVYPRSEDIFRAFYLTDYKDVKVLIIGQDPYHQPNQANGLAFSVHDGVKKPPSLQNIYKEIENEYNITMSNSGDLTPWAKQGVLLLNTILTVTKNKPMSHANMGWEIFTDKVINLLQEKDYLVYILLGSHAGQYERKITNKNHLVLKTSHPSPLSSFRGFLGSNIFKKANEYLKKKDIKEINWII